MRKAGRPPPSIWARRRPAGINLITGKEISQKYPIYPWPVFPKLSAASVYRPTPKPSAGPLLWSFPLPPSAHRHNEKAPGGETEGLVFFGEGSHCQKPKLSRALPTRGVFNLVVETKPRIPGCLSRCVESYPSCRCFSPSCAVQELPPIKRSQQVCCFP